MRPLVTPDEMTVADQAVIGSGTSAETLMDRAGRAVARAVIQVAGGRYGITVTIVCGKGNNGGDGFVAARVLRREGVAVRCVLVGDLDQVKGAARAHLELLRARGVSIQRFNRRSFEGSDVVVDALFGTGFRGRPEGIAEDAIDAINSAGCPVVAIDIPSGVDGTSGAVEGRSVDADVTVALAAQKIGTAVGKGASHSGVVTVADIGIPTGVYRAVMSTRDHIASLLPRRELDSHKRSRGSVAILGGSVGMSGAVILAARGAMRTGGGYVTAGVTSAIQPIVASDMPEVLTRSVSDEDALTVRSLDEFKPVLEKATALAVGPGLGRGRQQADLVEAILASVAVTIVLDADGLNVLGPRPTSLIERSEACVITPHPTELARLLDLTTEEVQADRVEAVRRAARAFGCTVVLKGFRSLIADGDRLAVNPTGGPSLATAGTGDVLTGVIAALAAQGLSAFDASVAGTYLHGLAGEICGEGGLAGDVADAIPDAMTEL